MEPNEMNMEQKLQGMLNEVVVTPYEADITERLAEICDIFAKNLTVKTIDRYIVQFIYNKPDKEFKKEVEAKYSELCPSENPIILPPLFAIVLSQYIVMTAFERYLKGLDLAACSLILMNYMIIRKGSLVRLILPIGIEKMFFKMESYVDTVDNIKLIEDYRHAKGILEEEDYILKHIDDAGLKEEVRSLVKEAYIYKRSKTIQQVRKSSSKRPYSKVYKGLAELINHTNWLFLKNDVVATVKDIISEEVLKKTSTIDNIISELRKDEDVILPYEKPKASSVLLGYINDGKVPQDLKNRRLTVLEFGVYIYYELLLEHIIHEYYD